MTKFVYFDLGGVVIKDFSATNKWEELLDEFKIDKEFWNRHYGRLDSGYLPNDVSIDYPTLLEAFVSRFERNEDIWLIIDKVKKTCGIGLYTNMYPGMLESIKNHSLMPRVEWNVIVDSSVEKIEKSDPKLFEIAQKRSGVRKSEILYVENSVEKIEAAQKYGWTTFFFDSSDYKASCKKLMKVIERIAI